MHYPQTKSNGSASGHRSRLAAGQDRCFLRITFQTHSQPRLDRGGGHAPLPCRPLPQFQFQPKYLFVHAHVGGPALFYIKMKANRKPTNVINSSTACLGVWSPQAGAERTLSPGPRPTQGNRFSTPGKRGKPTRTPQRELGGRPRAQGIAAHKTSSPSLRGHQSQRVADPELCRPGGPRGGCGWCHTASDCASICSF